MKIEILKPIAGIGDQVAGMRHRFALEPGMVVEVSDEQALGWIEGGIARTVDAPAAPVREAAALPAPRRRKGPAHGV